LSELKIIYNLQLKLLEQNSRWNFTKMKCDHRQYK
jgi:hypothetical protein